MFALGRELRMDFELRAITSDLGQEAQVCPPTPPFRGEKSF